MTKKLIPLAVPDIGENEIELIKQVFDTNFLTEGKFTADFETEVANYLGVKNAIACTSCTTALHTVFECLNIKGKEVMVSDYTYPASAEAIISRANLLPSDLYSVAFRFCSAIMS